MEDPARSNVNFTSLPREIRGQVYSHVLTSVYRVDTSPSLMYTQPLEKDRAFAKKNLRYQPASTPSHSFGRPSDRLGILRVNKAIGEEAREILYRNGAFVFHMLPLADLSLLAFDFTHLRAVEWMRDLELRLDIRPRYPTVARNAVSTADRLLLQLAVNKGARGICTIKILHGMTCELPPLLLKGFPHSLHALTNFGTVEVRIEHPYSHCVCQTVSSNSTRSKELMSWPSQYTCSCTGH